MTRMEQVRRKSGLTRAAFSRKYNIPIRTLEGWEYGVRQPPAYLPELLERVVEMDCIEAKSEARPTAEHDIQ